jgi:hypothetical protein
LMTIKPIYGFHSRIGPNRQHSATLADTAGSLHDTTGHELYNK